MARALAQDTEVMMLDEATSNLDIAHTIEIMRVLQAKVRKADTTVIAAIHDLNLAAAFCDEFIVLNEGKIYALGPVTNILTSKLLDEVFSVAGVIFSNGDYPRVEFQMHS